MKLVRPPRRGSLAGSTLVVLLLMAPAAGGQTTSQAPLRVASYNALNLDGRTSSARIRALADNLERVDADLIFLQEVSLYGYGAERLERELNRRTPTRRYTLYWTYPKRTQGIVLLSRYRPSSYRAYNFTGISFGLDRVLYADFTIRGTKLRFVAVHLKAGIRSYRDVLTRNRQAELLARNLVQPALRSGKRVVVLGDFNDLDPRVRYANGRRPHASSRVFDLFRRHASRLRNTDGDMPRSERRSHQNGYMYDHFLVDDRLPAQVSVARPKVSWASDHYPVYADLRLGARPVRQQTSSHRTIPGSGQTLSDAISLTAAGKVVNEVSVRIRLRHPRLGDLEIKLRHGNKTKTLLRQGEATGRSWTFDRRITTTHFKGAAVSGRWTLQIRYRGGGSGSGGSLEKWALRTAAKD